MSYKKPNITDLHDYQSNYGGLTSYLREYAGKNLTGDVLIALTSVLFPSFRVYQDCVLWAEPFDIGHWEPESFEKWKIHFDGDMEAVERMANHIHLSEHLSVTKHLSDHNFRYFAQKLRLCWKCELERQFPDRKFRVSVEDDPDGDITITFWQLRTT